jgi:hypothetical protein
MDKITNIQDVTLLAFLLTFSELFVHKAHTMRLFPQIVTTTSESLVNPLCTVCLLPNATHNAVPSPTPHNLTPQSHQCFRQVQLQGVSVDWLATLLRNYKMSGLESSPGLRTQCKLNTQLPNSQFCGTTGSRLSEVNKFFLFNLPNNPCGRTRHWGSLSF